MFRVEHNVETGEIIEIPLTAQEIKEIEKLQKEAAKQQAIIDAELAEKEAARQALLDKLGITADEAKLLLG
jgi:hypothetical protein